jgi:hypothetical protein
LGRRCDGPHFFPHRVHFAPYHELFAGHQELTFIVSRQAELDTQYVISIRYPPYHLHSSRGMLLWCWHWWLCHFSTVRKRSVSDSYCIIGTPSGVSSLPFVFQDHLQRAVQSVRTLQPTSQTTTVSVSKRRAFLGLFTWFVSAWLVMATTASFLSDARCCSCWTDSICIKMLGSA